MRQGRVKVGAGCVRGQIMLSCQRAARAYVPLDARQILCVGLPRHLQHPLQLIHGGIAREAWFPHEHLADDTPNSPHVHACCVAGRAQEDLRGSVPASCDVVCKDGRIRGAGAT